MRKNLKFRYNRSFENFCSTHWFDYFWKSISEDDYPATAYVEFTAESKIKAGRLPDNAIFGRGWQAYILYLPLFGDYTFPKLGENGLIVRIPRYKGSVDHSCLAIVETRDRLYEVINYTNSNLQGR